MSSGSNTAVSRLKQDYLKLKTDPLLYITAEPLPTNILEWHFVLEGPVETPYEGGYYHGRIIFPESFPFKPPAIFMMTPSGRFKTDTSICLSITEYHPESWKPIWNVSSILIGLFSFMLDDEETTGTMISSRSEKKVFAYESLKYNLENETFCQLFPLFVDEIKEVLKFREDRKQCDGTSSK